VANVWTIGNSAFRLYYHLPKFIKIRITDNNLISVNLDHLSRLFKIHSLNKHRNLYIAICRIQQTAKVDCHYSHATSRFIWPTMIEGIIFALLALEVSTIADIQTSQATLHSAGIDWFVWPILLIVAWWILLARTPVILKVIVLPAIAISTYFTLFIAYNIMIS
jgi:hypothetical protein